VLNVAINIYLNKRLQFLQFLRK